MNRELLDALSSVAFAAHADLIKGCGSATDPGLCRFTRPA